MSLNTYTIAVNQLETLSLNHLSEMAHNFRIRIPVNAKSSDIRLLISNHLSLLHDRVVYKKHSRSADRVMVGALCALENRALRDIAHSSFIVVPPGASNEELCDIIVRAVSTKSVTEQQIHRLGHFSLLKLARRLHVPPQNSCYDRRELVRCLHRILMWALPSLDDRLSMFSQHQLDKWAAKFNIPLPLGLCVEDTAAYLVSNIDITNLQDMLNCADIKPPTENDMTYWFGEDAENNDDDVFAWPYGPDYNTHIAGISADPELMRVFPRPKTEVINNHPPVPVVAIQDYPANYPLIYYRSRDQSNTEWLLRRSSLGSLMLLAAFFKDAGIEITQPELNEPIIKQTQTYSDSNIQTMAAALAMINKRALVKYVRTFVPVTKYQTMYELFFTTIVSNQHLIESFFAQTFLRRLMMELNKNTPDSVLLTNDPITAAQVKQGLADLPAEKLTTVLHQLAGAYATSYTSNMAYFVFVNAKLVRFYKHPEQAATP